MKKLFPFKIISRAKYEDMKRMNATQAKTIEKLSLELIQCEDTQKSMLG